MTTLTNAVTTTAAAGAIPDEKLLGSLKALQSEVVLDYIVDFRPQQTGAAQYSLITAPDIQNWSTGSAQVLNEVEAQADVSLSAQTWGRAQTSTDTYGGYAGVGEEAEFDADSVALGGPLSMAALDNLLQSVIRLRQRQAFSEVIGHNAASGFDSSTLISATNFSRARTQFISANPATQNGMAFVGHPRVVSGQFLQAIEQSDAAVNVLDERLKALLGKTQGYMGTYNNCHIFSTTDIPVGDGSAYSNFLCTIGEVGGLVMVQAMYGQKPDQILVDEGVYSLRREWRGIEGYTALRAATRFGTMIGRSANVMEVPSSQAIA